MSNTQIDLIIKRADRVINLCETKYSTDIYTLNKEEDLKLLTRQSDFKEETTSICSIVPTLFTTFGLKEKSYSGGIQTIITLDDLFEL